MDPVQLGAEFGEVVDDDVVAGRLDEKTSSSAETYERAVRLAELPDVVRGYETVKLRNVTDYVAQLRELGLEPPVVTTS